MAVRSVLVALVALMAAVAMAEVPRIRVSQTQFSMDEGMAVQITFSLTQPFVCPPDEECTVTVALTNAHPDSLYLETCHVKWQQHEWHQDRVIQVRATEDFVDDAEETFLLITEPAVSNSKFYTQFNPADIQFTTKQRPTAACSATGDPHYRTFDGRYYHIRPNGKVVFYKSKAENRVFEVQTDMYRFNGRPAVQCGLAAREGNDVVVISWCATGHNIEYRLSCGSTECDQGKWPRVGVTSSSNPTYTIDFKSGAQVKFDVHYWSAIGRRYMNLYVKAPGVDKGLTAGVCGNNDNNNNNDVAVGHDQWIENLATLSSEQRTLETDLFNWYPDRNNLETSPYYADAEACPVPADPFIRPILNQPDVEDITDLLKDKRVTNDDNLLEGLDFNLDDFVLVNPNLNRAEALLRCETIRSSLVAQACVDKFPNLDLQPFIENCAEDLVATGGDNEFIEVAVADLQDECADLGNRNMSTWELDNNGERVPSKDLQNVMCPTSTEQPCSGNGQCVETKCHCNAGFLGADCSVNPSLPPVVESADRPLCDGRGLLGCDIEVAIIGSNFYSNGSNVRCMFGDQVTSGTVLGSVEVRCRLPTNQHRSAPARSVPLRVSTDGGQTYSALNPAVTYTWYDSVCEICNATSCSPNPASCFIDGQCYVAEHARPDNVCQRCKPALAQTAWSYDHSANTASCGPVFAAGSYTGLIVASAVADTLLVTVDATNPLLQSDPSHVITYSIQEGDDAEYFKIDPTSGEVRLTQDIVVSESFALSFRGYMIVVATDEQGQTAYVPVHVRLLAANEQPLFARDTLNFTFPESTQPGYTIGQITATDTDAFSNLEYAFIVQEAGFAGAVTVNRTTGQVTLNQALNYEEKSHYRFELQARDDGGASDFVEVRFFVTDVNEAPTDILINSTQVPENGVDVLVGVLSAVDEDFVDSHTFTVLAGDFAVADGKLYTTKAFDYENPAERQTSVTLRATDKGGLTFDKTLTITITNVNEPPTDITLDQTTFAETQMRPGEDLAIITVTDPDVNDVIACALVDDDEGRFAVLGQVLKLVKAFNYEAAAAHALTIACFDEAGAQVDRSFVITVTDEQEAPQNIVLNQVVVAEDAPVGTKVGVITAEDQDADAGAMTFAMADPEAPFELKNTQCGLAAGRMVCSVDVFTTGPLDADLDGGVMSILVRATDNNDMAAMKELQLKVENVNEPPSGLNWVGQTPTVREDAADGAVVGRLVVADEDAVNAENSPRYTFELLNTDGVFGFRTTSNADARRRSSSNANRVEAYAAEVVLLDHSLLNAETMQGYMLSVRVTDEGGLSAALDAPITIEDEPLRVVFKATNLAVAAVAENEPAQTVVGQLAVAGLNAGQSATSFALASSSHHADAFVVRGQTLRTLRPIDAEYEFTLAKILVAFTLNTGETKQSYVEVAVTDVAEPAAFYKTPHLHSGSPDTDVRINQTSPANDLMSFFALDPEGDAFTLSVSSNNDALTDILSIDQQPGSQQHVLSLLSAPTQASLRPGNYKVTITAKSSDGLESSHQLTLRVAGSADPDAARDASTGTGSNSQASTGMIGVIVGCVAGLLLVVLVVLVVLRRRQRRVTMDAKSTFQHNEAFDNPTFVDAQQTVAFVPGVSNPLYEWYAPDLTRQDAAGELTDRPDGAFVVRDSKATPGWHILGVKAGNQVLHEKIRRDEEGLYELVPSNNEPQPAFYSLPDLIHYYGSQREEVPFTLDFSGFSNPMYAVVATSAGESSSNGHYAAAGPWMRDMNAPMVPLKESQMHAVQQLAGGEDIYTNAQEANEALSSTLA